MSVEGINLETPCTLEFKKSELFQAQTTHFQINPLLAKKCHESAPDAIPVILHGSKTTKLVVGRGHDATVKIGKSNKRVSREHVAIEHKPHLNGFEMTILSPNGALIDHIIFDQGEHVPIMEGTLIEIVGNKLLFQGSLEEVIISIQAPPKEVVAITTTIVTDTIKPKKPLTKPLTKPLAKPSMKPLTLEDEIIQVLGMNE